MDKAGKDFEQGPFEVVPLLFRAPIGQKHWLSMSATRVNAFTTQLIRCLCGLQLSEWNIISLILI